MPTVNLAIISGTGQVKRGGFNQATLVAVTGTSSLGNLKHGPSYPIYPATGIGKAFRAAPNSILLPAVSAVGSNHVFTKYNTSRYFQTLSAIGTTATIRCAVNVPLVKATAVGSDFRPKLSLPTIFSSGTTIRVGPVPVSCFSGVGIVIASNTALGSIGVGGTLALQYPTGYNLTKLLD